MKCKVKIETETRSFWALGVWILLAVWGIILIVLSMKMDFLFGGMTGFIIFVFSFAQLKDWIIGEKIIEEKVFDCEIIKEKGEKK
jgi:membrane-bound ClpP family serine protease